MMRANWVMLLAIAGLFLAVTLVVPPAAEAQKKPKAKTTVQKEKPQAAEEEATEPEHPAPVLQPAASSSGGVVDIMKKFIGQKTNLGILKKVNKDYAEFDDDNTVLTVPLLNIHSLKQVTDKDENDSTIVRLEVRLTAKD